MLFGVKKELLLSDTVGIIRVEYRISYGAYRKMENSYKYFENRACKYFPCHKDYEQQGLNCLFCYCPMYAYKDCLGNPLFKENSKGMLMKHCEDCEYPHKPENYERIMEFLKERQ